jgi:hypothetical protein
MASRKANRARGAARVRREAKRLEDARYIEQERRIASLEALAASRLRTVLRAAETISAGRSAVLALRDEVRLLRREPEGGSGLAEQVADDVRIVRRDLSTEIVRLKAEVATLRHRLGEGEA